MKRIGRRDSPIHSRYRRDESNGRDSNSYRNYGVQSNRSRPMQQSPPYERHNPRSGCSSFSRSQRDYDDSGRQSGSGSFRSGPPVRRFNQRSGNSGGHRSSDMYDQGSHSDRLLQGLMASGDLIGQSGTKIDPVFAAAAAAALNATFSASNSKSSSGNMYSPNSSAVAAVAAAAMNAAAIAAAIGGGPSSSNGSSFQFPGLGGSHHSLKSCGGGNRSPHYDRRGGGDGYHGSRTRDRLSPPYRSDGRRSTVNSTTDGHPTPEDDPTATRTLFVGNLPPDIRASQLQQLFDVYGIIEDIDIKRPQNGSPNEPAYAFIKFVNVSMAYRAKLGMAGKRIDGYVCKVGYGKVSPTRCLWVGGLGPWTTYPNFASLVERVSRPKKIIWPSGKGYANILFYTSEDAASVANALRGVHIGTGGNHRLRVDFTDESHMVNSGTIDSLRRGRPGALDSRKQRFKREGIRHQRSVSRSPLRRSPVRRSRSFSSSRGVARSPSVSGDGGRTSRSPTSPQSHSRTHSPAVGVSEELVGMPEINSSCGIGEVTSCLSGPVWKAVFALKKSNFSCHLYAVTGDTALADQLFPRHHPKPPQTPPDDEEEAEVGETDDSKDKADGDATVSDSKTPFGAAVNSPLLRISQRLRLNVSKCEEIKKRMKTVNRGDFCMLLATESVNEVVPTVIKAEDADNHNRQLTDLITYLASKEAAGVVVVSADGLEGQCDGDDQQQQSFLDSEHSRVLHVLPPGDLSIALLVEGGISCLRQKRVEAGDNYLVILLSKNSGFM
ncbi:unnamed protein product [Rodentolepis nana]|uniref:RNA-binding protein 15B n=1 Tax=Rodentolepis nana TaxID=102285 RepID=A0A0R3TPR6_RODNA|nr:unnamed protein product [Rodentolepis nana]